MKYLLYKDTGIAIEIPNYMANDELLKRIKVQQGREAEIKDSIEDSIVQKPDTSETENVTTKRNRKAK